MSPRPLAETAFTYLHHLVTVPVRVAGSDARFVLDTGIGLTLVTDAFARTIGCGRAPPPSAVVGCPARR